MGSLKKFKKEKNMDVDLPPVKNLLKFFLRIKTRLYIPPSF
jgi:hypothetical protein